jgi:23S rRNA pseudouridine2605 synthase
MAVERLQKILAGGGIASRRAAEQMIREGRVRVNGRVITELGTKADPRSDRIEVDGKRVVRERPVYLALHKPRGFVTTMSDPEGRPTIRDLLKPHGIPARVFPVGRLDFNTSGILLLTNDGEFSDGLLHPRRAVPKTYVVKVAGLMEPKDLDRWREGVQLEDGRTLPAEAFFLRHETDKTWFQITIREGRNQQIRRMGEATGFRVMRLARVAFAGVSSDGIKPGDLRQINYDELVEMKKNFGVPRRPGVGREQIEGWNPKPRAGVLARRSGQQRERDREPDLAEMDSRARVQKAKRPAAPRATGPARGNKTERSRTTPASERSKRSSAQPTRATKGKRDGGKRRTRSRT